MEADGVADAQAEDSILLGAIERLSRSFVEQSIGSMTAAIANGLAEAGPVDAAGVWLEQDGRVLRRAWSVAAGAEVDEAAVDEIASRQPEATSWRRLGRSCLTVVPLLRGEDRIGALAVVSWRALVDAEVSALKLLARQAAAEIAPQSAEGDAPGAMSRFIALLTHELRSPLTALRGNVQLAGMAARKGDLERTTSRIEAALKGVDSVTALVQNLQDISQLERGTFQLHPMPAEVAPAVESAARRAERMVEIDHPVIEIETQPSLVALDAVRLEQAFFNILLNALIYSNGGQVRVQLATGDERVLVTVADRGIGIPRDELAHIFEPYFRGELARHSHAKGLGLGLTISQATIERHGGRIEVESTVGKGSTFTVQLPLFSAA